jgi:hypothetical protein
VQGYSVKEHVLRIIAEEHREKAVCHDGLVQLRRVGRSQVGPDRVIITRRSR